MWLKYVHDSNFLVWPPVTVLWAIVFGFSLQYEQLNYLRIPAATATIVTGIIVYASKRIRQPKKSVYKSQKSDESSSFFSTHSTKMRRMFSDATILGLSGASQHNTVELSSEYQKLCNSLRSSHITTNRFLFDRSKDIYNSFNLLRKQSLPLLNNIHIIGLIDAYVSIATLFREHSSLNTRYSFASYTSGTEARVEATHFWHPSLGRNAVLNSLDIGGGLVSHNTVISGPNAGGKSTAMKAITLCILFAQTIGIVPAESFTCTPFSKIQTFLNITDDSGQNRSLLQAEITRAAELIRDIESLPPHHFGFTLLDEIFIGTEPVEGEAGAYGVARKLSDLPQHITLLATHFKGLTTLPYATADTDAPYQNMHVRVTTDDDGAYVRDASGKLDYPYTLESGTTTQRIALDIMEQENFDPDIIATARDVLSNPEHYTPKR